MMDANPSKSIQRGGIVVATSSENFAAANPGDFYKGGYGKGKWPRPNSSILAIPKKYSPVPGQCQRSAESEKPRNESVGSQPVFSGMTQAQNRSPLESDTSSAATERNTE